MGGCEGGGAEEWWDRVWCPGGLRTLRRAPHTQQHSGGLRTHSAPELRAHVVVRQSLADQAGVRTQACVRAIAWVSRHSTPGPPPSHPLDRLTGVSVAEVQPTTPPLPQHVTAGGPRGAGAQSPAAIDAARQVAAAALGLATPACTAAAAGPHQHGLLALQPLQGVGIAVRPQLLVGQHQRQLCAVCCCQAVLRVAELRLQVERWRGGQRILQRASDELQPRKKRQTDRQTEAASAGGDQATAQRVGLEVPGARQQRATGAQAIGGPGGRAAASSAQAPNATPVGKRWLCSASACCTIDALRPRTPPPHTQNTRPPHPGPWT